MEKFILVRKIGFVCVCVDLFTAGLICAGTYKGDKIAIKHFNNEESKSFKTEYEVYSIMNGHNNVLRYIAQDNNTYYSKCEHLHTHTCTCTRMADIVFILMTNLRQWIVFLLVPGVSSIG